MVLMVSNWFQLFSWVLLIPVNCFRMVFDSIQLFFNRFERIHKALQWVFSMGFNEFRWFLMDANGFQWFPMDREGFNWLQWFAMIFSIAFNGFLWNAMVFLRRLKTIDKPLKSITTHRNPLKTIAHHRNQLKDHRKQLKSPAKRLKKHWKALKTIEHSWKP